MAAKYKILINKNRQLERLIRKEAKEAEAEKESHIAMQLLNDKQLKRNIEYNPTEDHEDKNSKDINKSSKNIFNDRFKMSSNKSLYAKDDSDNSVLSYHDSSLHEEEILNDIREHLKDDINLAKIAKKMHVNNLYKKYFNFESENKVVEKQAVEFINNVKDRQK